MTRSKTEQNYRDAGMKKPKHRDRVDAELTHVDPEYQSLDATEAAQPSRKATPARRTPSSDTKES